MTGTPVTEAPMAETPMTETQWRGGRGLQPERTALDWQRTNLGLLGNGGLFALRSEELGRRSAIDYVVSPPWSCSRSPRRSRAGAGSGCWPRR